MKKIIFLQGLPGSGKSTYARELLEKHPGQYKRINKDDLRSMVDGGKRSKANEKMVLVIRDNMIVEFLREGYNVIVDDTNFAPFHLKRMEEIGRLYEVDVVIKLIDTDLQTCIERDAKREKSVGKRVIEDMYRKYLKKEFEQLAENPELPNCIICDVDGTLAKCGDRDIYNTEKVYLDTVINPVRHIVNSLSQGTTYIVIVTGRDGKYLDVTKKWLKDNNINYNAIFTRQAGDSRKDTIVKKEIYDNYIKGKYNVLFTIDDRHGVVDMWRDIGIFTFDVNQERSVF